MIISSSAGFSSPVAAISKYENEKIPLTTETIKKWAELFRVPTDYLLGKTDEKEEQEQNEPEYTALVERQLLELYMNYVDHGYTDSLTDELRAFFPELAPRQAPLKPAEEKNLSTFKCLNEDNRDIIIWKAKELLREQLYDEPFVAAEGLRKASGK